MRGTADLAFYANKFLGGSFMELQKRSSGVAKGGLATGITGTALGGLNTLTLLGMGANALGGFGRNN